MINNKYSEDDIQYVCSLITYIARETRNYVSNIIGYFDTQELQWQLDFAHVNHCLTFEQAAERVIERLNIKEGTYFNGADQPSCTDLGLIYSTLIVSFAIHNKVTAVQAIKPVLSSKLSDALSEYSFPKTADIKTESSETAMPKTLFPL